MTYESGPESRPSLRGAEGDEAIQNAAAMDFGLLRFARNDGICGAGSLASAIGGITAEFLADPSGKSGCAILPARSRNRAATQRGKLSCRTAKFPSTLNESFEVKAAGEK
jgi:hypothetical protein